MSTGNLSDASLRYFEEKKIKSLLEELMHDLLIALPDDPLAFLHYSLQRQTPLRLIVSGPPGCGKGTQGTKLAERYGLEYISVGDFLRREAVSGSESGLKMAPFVTEGSLVPDELFVPLVVERLRSIEGRNQGWVLDGFPRTRAQAIYLQEASISPQRFLYIDVPDDVATHRSLTRHVGVKNQPVAQGVDTSTKVDDTPEAIATRLQYFSARKEELTDCYAPFYVRIDGSKSVDDVFDDLREQVDSIELPH